MLVVCFVMNMPIFKAILEEVLVSILVSITWEHEIVGA